MATHSGFALFTAGALLATACGYVETKEVAAPRVPSGTATLGGGGAAVSFAAQVLPVLTRLCSGCHDAATRTAGLDLTSYAGVMEKPGVVVPGDPDASLLVQVLEQGRMPPGGLPGPTPEEISALRRWIEAGATDN